MTAAGLGRASPSGTAARRFDWIATVAIGLLVFHLIRTHLLERYRVASASMAPTLHGDPHDGDLVLVDRTAWWFDRSPSCGDLVVVRARDGDASDPHLVKRFVTSGPRVVEFAQGDVFVGEGRGHSERLVKAATDRERRLVRWAWPAPSTDAPVFLHVDSARWHVGAAPSAQPDSPATEPVESRNLALHLQPVAEARELFDATTPDAQDARSLSGSSVDPYLPGHVSTAEPVGSFFIGADGRLIDTDGPSSRDFGMDVTLWAHPGARTLQLVHEFAEVYFAFRLPIATDTGGGAEALGTFAIYGQPHATFAFEPLPIGRSSRLEFGYLDGRFFLVRDGVVAFELPYELPRESRLMIDRAGRKRDLLHIGVAGTAGLTVSALTVFHDAHYATDTARVFELGPDEIFVLGDNANDSSDSRVFRERLRRDDLIGRPCAVIGPARRWRLL